jgi:hypothetical protein
MPANPSPCSKHDIPDHIEISQYYWNQLNQSAAKRDLDFKITVEYVWRIFQRQKGRCALSGLRIKQITSRSRLHTDNSASLDRIDPKKGYVPGNVQWVHKDINKMKQDFDEEHFVHLCSLVGKIASEL